MKIIEILNKIANGEIETFYKFKYRNKIVTMGYLIDNYLFLEILNDKIEIIEDTSKEEKKIPEKLEDFDIQGLEVSGYSMSQAEYLLEDGVKENREMINWILDYLKSKGDE